METVQSSGKNKPVYIYVRRAETAPLLASKKNRASWYAKAAGWTEDFSHWLSSECLYIKGGLYYCTQCSPDEASMVFPSEFMALEGTQTPPRTPPPTYETRLSIGTPDSFPSPRRRVIRQSPTKKHLQPQKLFQEAKSTTPYKSTLCKTALYLSLSVGLILFIWWFSYYVIPALQQLFANQHDPHIDPTTAPLPLPSTSIFPVASTTRMSLTTSIQQSSTSILPGSTSAAPQPTATPLPPICLPFGNYCSTLQTIVDYLTNFGPNKTVGDFRRLCGENVFAPLLDCAKYCCDNLMMLMTNSNTPITKVVDCINKGH
jgi:hypothetical protein